MRSLFIKLFVSFIIIVLFTSITTVAISLWAQVGPYSAIKKRVEYYQQNALAHSLTITSLAVKQMLQKSGKNNLSDYLHKVAQQSNGQIFLVKDEKTSFFGHPIPPVFSSLIFKARKFKDRQFFISKTNIIVAIPFYVENGQTMILVGSTPKLTGRPAIQKFGGKSIQRFGPLHHPLALPALVMIIIAGIGCFVLARSLTSPIKKLRKATQIISMCDYSTRVKLSGKRGDEIVDLGHDFNIMAEKTQSLLHSQKRMLSDISHELRSPLTRQKVALELARKQSEGGTPHLARIALESERINELIDQLLTLTRLESNLEQAKEPVKLNKLLNKIIVDVEFEMGNKKGKIKFNTFDNINILGYAEMLKRALENVIRNALYYTAPKRGIKVELTVKNECVIILVQDYGPGVPDKYLKQIFKPFFRVSESRKRDSGGTGIGLAIAQQAVIHHGGQIKARNIDGAETGLQVEICLPEL